MVVLEAPSRQDSSGISAAAALSLAQKRLEQTNFRSAAADAAYAAKRAPSVADYAEYIRAEAEYQMKDYPAVELATAHVFEHSPVSPLVGQAAALLVQADLERNRPQDALRLIQKYFRRLPQPQGDLLLAQCFEATGDLPQAAEYDQRVYYNYPTAPEATVAANALADLKKRLGSAYPPVMPSAMLGRAKKLFQAHQADAAQVELEAAIPQIGGAERDLAQVRLGEAEFFANHTRDALKYLSALQVNDPAADAERLFFLIRCARTLDAHANVKRYVKELKQRHPSSPWRLKALIYTADQARVDNKRKVFLPLYRACAAAFGDDADSSWCHWRLAFDSYWRNSADAYDLLREQVEKYAREPAADNALYFLGRECQRRKNDASARACYQELISHFPNTYYGVLARKRLEEIGMRDADPSPAMLHFLNGVRWPARPVFPSFRPGKTTAERIARANLLHTAGLDDFAEGELEFGAQEDDDQRNVYAYRLAKIAAAQHKPARALYYIQTLTPRYLYMPLDEAPVGFWKLAFPLPYRHSIEIHSKREKLDPYLVAALIRQESEFNAKVVSPAHAYGLMQIRPSTGRALGRHLGLGRIRIHDLLQPDKNIEMGAYFFRQLYKEFDGDVDFALAAYNAGPSRAQLWRTWGPYSEPAEFIETVPFRETRAYIQLVLRNADVYRRLYAKKKPEVPQYHAKPAPKSGRRQRASE